MAKKGRRKGGMLKSTCTKGQLTNQLACLGHRLRRRHGARGVKQSNQINETLIEDGVQKIDYGSRKILKYKD